MGTYRNKNYESQLRSKPRVFPYSTWKLQGKLEDKKKKKITEGGKAF